MSETPPPDELDPALLARLPQRDAGAMAAFFEAYFDRVYGYIRGLVRSETLAEDLTQDVFLQIHRNLESYDPTRPLRPWVFTIAVNRVRDHWRSRAHHQGLKDTSLDVEDGLALSLEARDSAPDLPLERLEDAEGVRAAVAGLPPTLREVLVLRVFEEQPFEQIAEVLGSNTVAVRKRYSRALAELRQRLGAGAPEGQR